MVVDCHVHLSATVWPRGAMSQKLLGSIAFKFMRWRLRLDPAGDGFDDELVELANRLIGETPGLDAAVMLAFDAVYDREGRRDNINTHLYVANDYVAQGCRANPKRMLFA